MRKCKQCNQDKERSAFKVPDSKRPVKCIECLQANESERSKQKHARRWSDAEYREKNLARYRFNSLVRRGAKLSREQFDRILEQEKNGCEICGSKEKLHIDHNHITGLTRGVLCQGCNHGIGNFREDAGSLLKAIEYLKRYGLGE